MKDFLIFILLAALPVVSWADGGHLGKKSKTGCNGKKIQKKHQIQSIEELSFLVPPPSENKKCRFKKRYQRAIVNFYQWYLDNQSVISNGLQEEDNQKDLLPPFHVSYKSLHRFYELIQEKYPNWISELTPKTPSSEEEIPATGAKEGLNSDTRMTRSDLDSCKIPFSST